MKKSTIILIAIVAIIGLWAWKGYNGMVTADETVKNAWAKVQSDYQRRADLIPNLVNVVKGYAEHEKGTLEGVIEARAKATQININVDDLTEENMKKIQAAQGELSSALNKLMAVAEAYPDLKANENFKELQSQLEGTENRIKESRNKYARTHTIEILDFGDEETEYLQILYDRIPTLPQSLRRDFSALSHLWQNIAHRVARTRQ